MPLRNLYCFKEIEKVWKECHSAKIKPSNWTWIAPFHRGTICQFPVQWIYYYHSIESIEKKTGKTHLCAFDWNKTLICGNTLPNFKKFNNFNWKLRWNSFGYCAMQTSQQMELKLYYFSKLTNSTMILQNECLSKKQIYFKKT